MAMGIINCENMAFEEAQWLTNYNTNDSNIYDRNQYRVKAFCFTCKHIYHLYFQVKTYMNTA